MSDLKDARTAKPRAPLAGWLAGSNDITQMFLEAARNPDLVNLAGGLPAKEVAPAPELADIAKRVIDTAPNEALGYGPIDGLPALREALAARFSTPEMALTAENVLVTTSGMQGLDLIGKVLLNPGDTIAVQFPAYLGAMDAWRPRGPVMRNMALDANDFDAVAALDGAKFAYAVPNFSNPTGKLVGEERRQQLVEASLATGAWIAEDDPYGGLSYDGPLPPKMLDLAARKTPGTAYDGPVVYMGTLSKEITPGLRVGWVIAAPEMIKAMTTAKQGSDMCTSGVTQLMALEALKAGLIEEIHPRIIALYRERRDALCQAMATHLSDWFEWEVPVGGMFVWAVGRDPDLDTDRLLSFAMKAGVCLSPSSVFDAEGRYRRAVRLNFTLNPADKLIEGVKRLANALRAMDTETKA